MHFIYQCTRILRAVESVLELHRRSNASTEYLTGTDRYEYGPFNRTAASAPGALGDAVAPPAQNVVAPPRVFVLFLHALDVTPGCTRIRGGGMQAPCSTPDGVFLDVRNGSSETGIMGSFRDRSHGCLSAQSYSKHDSCQI